MKYHFISVYAENVYKCLCVKFIANVTISFIILYFYRKMKELWLQRYIKKNQLVLKIYDIDVPLFTSDACRISSYRYHK